MNWPFRAHFLWRDTLRSLYTEGGSWSGLNRVMGQILLTPYGSLYTLWGEVGGGVGWVEGEGTWMRGGKNWDWYVKFKKKLHFFFCFLNIRHSNFFIVCCWGKSFKSLRLIPNSFVCQTRVLNFSPFCLHLKNAKSIGVCHYSEFNIQFLKRSLITTSKLPVI